MNLLLWIIDAFAGFVRRNPIFCLVILILAIGAPSLLAGLASVILYVIAAILLVAVVASLVLRWRIARLADRMEQQQHDRQQNPYGTRSQREGDVRIHINTESTEKRINDDVGDYVDFEEEKNR